MSRRGRHPHNRLTVAVVNRARPGRHADGNGLYLVVRPSLARSWIQRVTINKQRTDLGLGPYPLVSLACARRIAIENLLLVRAGGDPRVKAVSTGGPASPPFSEIYELVTENSRPGWKRKTTEATWRRDFEKYVLPIIGKDPIGAITLRKVREIVRPHWKGRNSKGYFLRQNLERVFDWAVAEKLQAGQPGCQPEASSSEDQKAYQPPGEPSVLGNSRGSSRLAGPSGEGVRKARGVVHRADQCPSQRGHWREVGRDRFPPRALASPG